MTKIGLLSDTHGYFDTRLTEFLNSVDEIWHAGDIGSLDLLNNLKILKPVRAVYGNIDGFDIRMECKELERFTIEDTDVLMTHIGGFPGRYEKKILKLLKSDPPDLFISGHSHILKVIYDKKNNLLHINPGAAGINGFQKVQTAVKFIIDRKNIKDLQIIELDRKKIIS
jgi:putative phosphoesterase